MSTAEAIAGQVYALQRKIDELGGQIAILERQNNRLFRQLSQARYLVAQSGMTAERRNQLLEKLGDRTWPPRRNRTATQAAST